MGPGESGASTVSQTEPVSVSKAGIEIKILAKPAAKCNSITDINDTVGIQIAAPPVDGEANLELVKYLSKILGLKKSQVTLDKGSKSRNKTVLVTGSSKEEILQKLKEEKGDS
ncbi:UPF0235 protein C15orf40 homolog [Ruditapes philippinarum]|uniref:UPF0235 protein C15orf40 homolog n=1 Tax=Ruditapes philippinarum TaxID=129788 RepID=UPI00295B8899|nr:UPF0235 protein C15orf40 homolog [Ruditapes philippinarum]